MTETKAVAVATPSSRAVSAFESEASFVSAQRMARALVTSSLVPAAYKGEEQMGNALIAMDMASRMGLSPIVVMQNLHVIEGRPSWGSSFIISALNACGLFGPIRWRIRDLGEAEASITKWVGPKGNRTQETHKVKIRDKEWIAYAVELSTGETIEGPPVTIGMAVAEGWYTKPGSKWVTMEDLMGKYRSAAFFGRLYAPHLLNGMLTADEVVDTASYRVVETQTPAAPVAAEAKPAGRASAVHAAMAKAAEASPAQAAEHPAEPDYVDAEVVSEPSGEQGAEHGDVFDVEDEEDGYQPS